MIEVRWTWLGGEYWNVDQAVRIEQKGAPARWANHFTWSDEPDVEGGWIGIETDIDRIDGSHGDTAVFFLRDASLLSADDACEAVGGGRRCELPVELDPDTFYRLRIWTLGGDGHWGAWFMDHLTSEEVHIATLVVPTSHTRVDRTVDRIELLPSDADCALAPMAVGYLGEAGANQVAPGEYEHVSIYKGSAVTAGCTGAVVEEFDSEIASGVVVSYGVP